MPSCQQPPDANLQAFTSELRTSIQTQGLQKLVLSKYCGDSDTLQRLSVRPVVLKEQLHLQFVFSHKTQDVTQNFLPDDALQQIPLLLDTQFKAAHLYTTETEIQLTISKKGKVLFHKKPNIQNTAAVSAPEQHNREKQRYLDLNSPFLTELGITDKQHQLIPAMSRKWKQINKFIEIFSTAIAETGLVKTQQLQVADFGSGKAYLTFALHDYLTRILGINAGIIGVELRQNLVDLCNQTATKLQLQGIQFEQGDVQHFKARGLNVMIALHACDTATDYAIHMGIAANADIIMCSPCCHKEIRPQITLPSVLAPALKYGIHLGQEAEMITDSLRALLLEANGYDTKVFEFISLEHTSKNKMILATKRKQARDNSTILQQIAELKRFYGIKQQCLETLLQQQTV